MSRLFFKREDRDLIERVAVARARLAKADMLPEHLRYGGKLDRIALPRP